MSEILEALFHRRAVKAFEPVEIPQVLREQILNAARHAPSSFNMQPYRFFWVESSPRKATAVKLCLGQMPAATASALVVAVADIGSLASDLASPVGVDAPERLQPRQSPRLRADGEDGPDPVHARTVRHFWRGQVGDSSTAEFVEDDRDATTVSTRLVKVGDEEYIVGLSEPDDCRRSAGTQHVPHGRIRWPQTLQISRAVNPVS